MRCINVDLWQDSSVQAMQVFRTFLFLTLLFWHFSAQAITWQEQAERLQLIGASLLESLPLAEPHEAGWSLKIAGAIPPSVNSTIGSKVESFPVPPLQAVPTVDWSFWQKEKFSAKVWLGILPPGAEKLLGLDPRVYEILAGLEIQLGPWAECIYFPLGFQWVHADVKGQLASVTGDDRLSVSGYSIYSGLGWRHSNSLWVNAMVAYRKSDSSFSIAQDQTELQFADKKAAFQIVAGKGFGRWRLGLGLLYVPERLMMPRVFASFRL